MAAGTPEKKPILTPEEALQAVIKNAPVSISVTDASGRLLFAAGKGLELLGVEREELLGAKAAEAFAEEKRIPELMRRVFRGEVVNAILEIRGRSVDVWMSPARNKTGKVVAAISIATDVTDRERMLRKLSETDRIVALAERAAQFGIWYSDPAHQGALIWTEGAYRIFGLARDAFDGRVETFFRLVHPDDLPRVRQASLDALAGKSRYDVEHRIVRPDGEVRWVHQEADVLFGPDRKPVQMVGMAQDITERKASEAALREFETRYRAIIETSPIGVAIHQDAKFVYVNRAFAEMVGTAAQELVGADIYRVVHPEFREIVRRRVEGDVHSGKVAPMIEERFVRSDGAPIDVEVVTAPIVIGGRPAAVTYAHDIRRRKARETELRAAQERFELAALATDDVLYDWDILTGDLWWNENLKVMLGHETSGEAARIGWWEAQIHPDDRPRVFASLQAAIDGGEDVWTGEYRFRSSSGGYVVVLDRGRIVRDAGGKAARMVGSMIDMTARKRMELRVRESEEKYRTLFELADDAIFVADAESGTIVDCNRKAESLLGRARTEIIGMRQTELHPPGLGEKYAEYFRSYMATGKVAPEQMYAYRKDGARVPIKISASMAHLGGKTYVTGVFHDVTSEVENAEEMLRRNQELERFAKVTTGRELKMMELKKENEDLRRQVGGKKP